MIYKPHVYQEHATQHVIDNPFCCLLLEMGLGKSVATLTAINELMFERCSIAKVLVVAPLRVARDTWRDEVAKWDHLSHFRLSHILGTEKQRKEAMKVKADIYIINRENIPWLVTYLGGAWPYDCVILDELTSFKSHKSARHKALVRVRPLMDRVVGLTGSPASNGIIDLWGQLRIIDKGERLGKHITPFREAYFKAPHKVNNRPVAQYKLLGDNSDDVNQNENAQAIFDKIKDICISMKASDWLSLPERIDVVNEVKLSPAIASQYKIFERDKVLEMDDTETLTAVSAAGLRNKLLQFANGAVYVDDKHNFTEIHNEKIEALGEMVEAANGNPMLVAYSFKSDLVRIQRHLKGLKPRLLSSTADMVDWNAGKIPFALGHSQSLGHGLNLQNGGNLVAWFGLTDSLEYYSQFVARLHRQGQLKSVINSRLLSPGTMDFDVLYSLEGKDDVQNALMKAVKAIIKKHRGH